jgi:SEFIR domain
MPTHPTAFISYSWDDEAHKEWVRHLATQLRADGVEG